MLSKKTKDELQRFFNTLAQKEEKEDEESKKEIKETGEKVDKKIKQLVEIDCIDLVQVNNQIGNLTAELDNLAQANASSEADYNLVKDDLENCKQTVEELDKEEIALQSELDLLEQEVNGIDAEVDSLRDHVSQKSD